MFAKPIKGIKEAGEITEAHFLLKRYFDTCEERKRQFIQLIYTFIRYTRTLSVKLGTTNLHCDCQVEVRLY